MFFSFLGTGTNAAYIESTKNVKHLGTHDLHTNQIVINTEWGAFGEWSELESIRTFYDRWLDDGTLNKGRQM